jgi:uncharacterized protein YjeT (DUF2065 family)
MGIAIKAIGVLIALMGLICLLSPVTIRVWFKNMERGQGAMFAVVINFLMGIFLVTSSRICTIPWIPMFVGMLALVKGLILLLYGPKRLIKKISVLLDRSLNLLRLSSVVSIALGCMLVASV